MTLSRNRANCIKPSTVADPALRIPSPDTVAATKVVFESDGEPRTLRAMDTLLRIRESSPSELLADRLELLALLASPEQAQDYRRQAEMLRAMIAIQQAPTRGMVAGHA